MAALPRFFSRTFAWLLLRPRPFRLPEAFALPEWAGNAANLLATTIIALLLERGAPVAGKLLVGLFVLGLSVVLLLALVWAVSLAVLLVGRRFGWIREEIPASVREEWARTWARVGGIPIVTELLLFWVWGLFYLAGDTHRVINRIALPAWAACFLAGCVVALVRGTIAWVRRRRPKPPSGTAGTPLATEPLTSRTGLSPAGASRPQ